MKLKYLIVAGLVAICLQASAQTMPSLCAEHLRVAYICAADLDAATVKFGHETQNIVGAVQYLENELLASARALGERGQEALNRACTPNALLHVELVKQIVKIVNGITLANETSERCNSGVELLKKM
jgi:ABC-type arginine/histidine transport system permease subunit